MVCLMPADATPQRAAQAAHIAQLEGSLADLQSEHQQLQAEIAGKEAAKQSSEQKLAQAAAEAAQAGRRAQDAEQLLETQNKELAMLHVSCVILRLSYQTYCCSTTVQSALTHWNLALLP